MSENCKYSALYMLKGGRNLLKLRCCSGRFIKERGVTCLSQAPPLLITAYRFKGHLLTYLVTAQKSLPKVILLGWPDPQAQFQKGLEQAGWFGHECKGGRGMRAEKDVALGVGGQWALEWAGR